MKFLFVFLILFLIFSSLTAKNSELFGKDKIMHFSQSALLTYWNYGVLHNYFSYNKKNGTVISVSITLTMGVSKELSDKYIKKTYFSKYDILYDTLGIFCGLVLINNLR